MAVQGPIPVEFVQADLEANRQVANALAELIVGGSLASVLVDPADDASPADAARRTALVYKSVYNSMQEAISMFGKGL